MPVMPTESDLLAHAVRLAGDNAAAGQLPFGALVVRDGGVVATGVNTVLRDGDPTAHAEVAAIRAASRALGTSDLAGSEVVSSCEPCPMCIAVARLAGIRRIAYAATGQTAAAAGFVFPPTSPSVEHVATAGAGEPFAAFAAGGRATASTAAGQSPVHELRFALTVEDYDGAHRFYSEALGLPIVEEWAGPRGRGAVLDAGRATLELLSVDQADLVDEIEVGRRVAGPVRVALEVGDSAATAERLQAAGAELLGGPVVTPWRHRNARLVAPDGLQLTLFTVLSEDG
jgi:tRNA(Arg) A34 adenosine deaminase TadA/catechol 2,3-dioxygenase-like lactoylglutathione lyase family enzyme